MVCAINIQRRRRRHRSTAPAEEAEENGIIVEWTSSAAARGMNESSALTIGGFRFRIAASL
jgi:hypothetical protein